MEAQQRYRKMRITNQVLAERIDGLHSKFDELKPDIKANTKFRLQASGVLGFATIIAGILGAGIVWSIDRIWRVVK